jgi:PST family polysaccharide transporter
MADKQKPISILRATALLGSSSMITILCGVLSSKIWAVIFGPKGVGELGLMQGLLALLTTVVSLGIPTGLVRQGSLVIAKGEEEQFSSLRQGAWLLYWLLAAALVLLVLLFHRTIAKVALGSEHQIRDLALVVLALMFSLASGLYNGTLNARHRVKALASSAVISVIVGTSVNLVLAWMMRERALGLSIVAGAMVGWVTSYCFALSERQPSNPTPWQERKQAAFSLARFGAPYTASILVGGGIANLLPMFINNQIGQEGVGYYRAASLIAVNYLAFMLNSMALDYYPRVASVSDQPNALKELVNKQFRITMLIGVPAILWCMSLAPLALPLIYTVHFKPANLILEWQLIGDIFKLSAWTLSYIILARCSSITYFCTEATAGLLLIVSTWLSMHYLGIAGIGVGYLITYSVYFIVVYATARHQIGFQWSESGTRLLVSIIVLAAILCALPLVPYQALRIGILVALSLAATIYALRSISRERRLRSSNNPEPIVSSTI